MKASLLVGMVCGVIAVLAAAGYYPWVDHVRVPSRTSVLPNGGRSEQLVIRLPADRIATASSEDSGSRLRHYPDSVALPEDAGDGLMLLEHFKVRNAAGDVIGIASRHTVESERRLETAWNVVIPSRGAILLRGPAVASTLDRRLAEAGFRQGEVWVGDVRIAPPAGERAGGAFLGGTGEFEGLTGGYAESWQITGVSLDGELRGTIELNTVSSRAL